MFLSPTISLVLQHFSILRDRGTEILKVTVEVLCFCNITAFGISTQLNSIGLDRVKRTVPSVLLSLQETRMAIGRGIFRKNLARFDVGFYGRSSGGGVGTSTPL